MRASGFRMTARGFAFVTVMLVLTAVTLAAGAVTLTPAQSDELLKRMMLLGKTETDVKSMPGITSESASRIVSYRKAGKGFATIDEFRQVSGISDADFAKLAAVFTKPKATVALDQPSYVDPSDLGKTPAPAAGTRRAPQSITAKSGTVQPKAESESPAIDLDVQANYFSVLPGYDLEKVDADKRKIFLDMINREKCSCGCSGETLGYCLVNDPGCPVVKARVKKVYTDIFKAAPVAPAAGGASH